MNLIPFPNEYGALLSQNLLAFTERAFYELHPNASFQDNWHLDVIASSLEACRRGELTRLILNKPPRYLKSHFVSVSFVAFVLGHNPAAKIICASYGQDLSNKHASDCRTVMNAPWYREVFPNTELESPGSSLQELVTTKHGFRLATSVGGVLTGRGADFIIIDDPLRSEEALSESRREAVNHWFDHTLYSRLDDKKRGRIIVVMQRLHADDLMGHVLAMEPWKAIRFPAIADEDEIHVFSTPRGVRRVKRRAGEALHREREPLEVLAQIREVIGEYNFASQYQQDPMPLGGGLVKTAWFKTYTTADVPANFDLIFQSWDSANKPTELSDYSVCSTWGVREKHIYLLDVFRKRLGYPELKRAVRKQAEEFLPKIILIEDKGSGTQLIQELVNVGNARD